jgi:hypothetical protein
MLLQTVTTVWRTELGTTLLNGFNSTTDESAYFRYLCFISLQRTAGSRQVPLPYGPAYRALRF